MIFVQRQNVYLVVLLVCVYLLLLEIARRRSTNEIINLSEVQIDLILDTTNNEHGDSVFKNSNEVGWTIKVEAKTNKDIDATRTTLKLNRKDQVCKIPVLNPFHPDITKFGQYSPKKPHCTYRWYSDVTDDGILMIRDQVKDKVKTARFGYIKRVNKDSERFTKMNVFYSQDKRDGVQIKQDYVKVEIHLKNGKIKTEFHLYPVRDFVKHPKKGVSKQQQQQRSLGELNIVFLCVDSLSRSAAIRNIPKFYDMVRDDPHSIIMKGHTIVGDGTTSQFTGILIGDLEANLPEARINFPGSGPVNRWPFIFNDYNKKGYATLYNEDSYGKETFALRLNGFAKKPTDRYLRPFWRGAKKFMYELLTNSPRCIHQLELRFLKRFMKNYQDMPIFSLFVMNAAHDIYSNFKLFNNDLYDFNKFLEDTGIRNNTISIVLGDHGARSSKYRATMVGKLEERLPFIAFSFPPWFKTKYPKEFRNFQNNSNILTAHFDIHATLKHLLKFDVGYKNNHKWGKSLFSDIAPLNRSCTEAGVKEHWCPCIDYETVDTKSDIAKKVSSRLLKAIAQKLKGNEHSNHLCETVQLSKILRIQKVKTNEKVQQFSGSFRKGCDGCGIKLNRGKKFTSDSYEIVVETKHGSALFEATLVIDRLSEEITINGDISRINMYGSHPNCIAKEAPHLRKFCYCKDQSSAT